MMNRIETRSGASSHHWQILSGLVVLVFTIAARAQFYAVTELGTLGGTNGMAYGINNHEQIVGAAQTVMGSYHAFAFEGGRMTDLGTLGGSNSWAYGINDHGWSVGAANLVATNMHAFLCTNDLMDSVMLDLGTLGGSNSAAWMIDMDDNMVGWAEMTDGSHHAFFMTNFSFGDMMDLGTAGGTDSEAYCINSNLMVVGYAMMSDGDDEPIMSTNALFGSSSMMTMGMGGMGASGGQSWFVNGLGDAAGEAEMPGGNHHAIVSSSGGMMGRRNVDLGTLGGTNSTAYCLTDDGTAIGTAQLANGMMHAFIVTNASGGLGRMVDLNDLIPTSSGWELMVARSMNASGQIIGWGMHAGHTNAFLLTPSSGPITVTTAPAPQVTAPGATMTLQLGMNSAEPLTYQWLRNRMPIPGATNSTLTLVSMSTMDAGQYTVTARNAVGTVANCSAAVSLFSMLLSNSVPHLMLAGPAGTHFRIDSSANLNSAAGWQTMTNLTLTSPMSQVIDPASPGGSVRFYRAVMLP